MTGESAVPLEENAELERQRNAKRTVAVCLFSRSDGRVLLMRTKRLPGSWQPIGGGIREGDGGPVGTIVREAREELDIEIDPAELRHVTDLPYDFGEGTIHCYTASPAAGLADLALDPTEVEEIGWFTIEEARALPAFAATQRLLQLVADDPS